MVVVGADIKKLGLIDPETFCDECLEEASYELRLGEQYFLCCQQGKKMKYQSFKKNNLIEESIPPLGSMFIQTEEIIDLKSNTHFVARFDLRIEYALKGLLLQVGPQVNPGYRGRLFGLLFNTSAEPVSIRYLDNLMEIEFVSMSKSISVDSSKEYLDLASFFKKYNIRAQDYSGPSLVDRLNTQIKQTNDKFSECDKKHTKHFGATKHTIESIHIRSSTIRGKISLIISLFSLLTTLGLGYCTHVLSTQHVKQNNNLNLKGIEQAGTSSQKTNTDVQKTRIGDNQ